MGKIVTQEPVKLICGLLWNKEAAPETVYPHLEKSWGPIASRSPVFDFNFTNYYLDESGPDLKKQYIAFEQLVDINHIPDLKLWSNDLEERLFMTDGKRSINIDPGYIADAKLVMATTKNLPHRVFVGKDIYTDLQLMFRKPSFFPISWTFADIKQPDVIDYFNHVRETYVQQLRTLHKTP